LEAKTSEQETRLKEALRLLSIEDPSLLMEEKDLATLFLGLRELHIEVMLNCIYHEFAVTSGPPSEAYRETILHTMETPGLLKFDLTIGTLQILSTFHLLPSRTSLFHSRPHRAN